MTSVKFYTLGCKLNQAETAMMVQDFLDRGYTVIGPVEKSDVFVLNTCTVTGRSDAKCRQVIRKILRENPETTVILVGCYPQVWGPDFPSAQGVDYILGIREKLNIFEYFPGPGKREKPFIHIDPVAKQTNIDYQRIGNYLNHTRAFLKIQNGCNNHCAYCIVPLARGQSRSVPYSDVLQQARNLISKEYQEIVLTGIHIGEYGREWKKPFQLTKLLHNMEKLPGLGRIRLSSLEPGNVNDALIELVASTDRICNHFHIPLQSGSDSVLTAMNRSYTTKFYRSIIEKIKISVQPFGLGTDLITGFPGETEAMFQETVQFIETLPFTYLHVFPFSSRNGTQAANLSNQVPPGLRMERARILREIGYQKKQSFMKSWLGQTVKVLLEARKNQETMSGLSSEYIRVQIPYEGRLKNKIVSIHLEQIINDRIKGRIVEG